VIAFLFPGQGAQSIGMLDSFLHEPVVQETLSIAEEVLGKDLGNLIHKGPKSELDNTLNLQPILLTVSFALYRLWQQKSFPEPSLLAGHSLGEYSALVASGSIDFKAALRLVECRAQVMQSTVSDGEMVAILGLDEQTVNALCLQVQEQVGMVEPANFNAPSQIVVGGIKDACKALAMLATEHGGKVIHLSMSVPSHCSLLQKASEVLYAHLQEIEILPPKIPVWQNCSNEATADPEMIRRNLAQQIASPVRWVELMNKIYQKGAHIFVECGAGSVLTGLGRRINKRAKWLSVASHEQFMEAGQFLKANIHAA